MKLGQTSLIVFFSKIIGSGLGFIATVYFARKLGAEVLGIYALVLALVAWLSLAGNVGITKAIGKRISEGERKGAYLTAGILFVLSIVLIISFIVLLGRTFIEAYVSGFEEYVAISVVWFIILLTIVKLSYSVVRAVLVGQHLVHIKGILEPINIGLRSLIQIALVFLGFNLLGMLVGYAIGVAAIALIGLWFVSIDLRTPGRRHFRSLFDYAKFAWLGGLKTRAFNDVDIVILGALVPSALVGVYSVAWSLSKFLNLFSAAVSNAVFPEISKVSAQETLDATAKYIQDAIAYAGFIAIPGLVGGLLLDDRLLRIYGEEFTQGTEVLWLLLLAILLYSYFRQFLNALNGIDRPDKAFRANAVFIASNVLLNVVLIWELGFVGAAIASAASIFLGLTVSYLMLTRIVQFDLPLTEISHQGIAAVCMGAVIWGVEYTIETTGVLEHNFAILLLLVPLGAGIYATLLLTISPEFRSTVDRNLPVDVPYLQ